MGEARTHDTPEPNKALVFESLPLRCSVRFVYRWLGPINSARSVTFADDIHGSPAESPKRSTVRNGKVASVTIPLPPVVRGDLVDGDSTRNPGLRRS